MNNIYNEVIAGRMERIPHIEVGVVSANLKIAIEIIDGRPQIVIEKRIDCKPVDGGTTIIDPYPLTDTEIEEGLMEDV